MATKLSFFVKLFRSWSALHTFAHRSCVLPLIGYCSLVVFSSQLVDDLNLISRTLRIFRSVLYITRSSYHDFDKWAL